MLVESEEMSYALIPQDPHAFFLSRLRMLKNPQGEMNSIYLQAVTEVHFLMDSFHVDTSE